jgi:Zn-dependent M28 family amino/carboxypeptidase
VPLGQVVAQLNVDMIGRSRREGDTNTANATLSGPDEIYVIGSRMMSSVLGSTSDAVNAGYLNLKFNFQYDDPKDPNRFFFRSDHVNYARKGISIIFYFNGIHEDYHKTTDTVDKIDFSKLERVARTVCATAATLAEADSRPLIDRELPAELR